MSVSASRHIVAKTSASASFSGAAVAGGVLLLAAAIVLIQLGMDQSAKMLLSATAIAATLVYWRLPALSARSPDAEQIDPLTGLTNRRYFHDAGQGMIESVRRRHRGIALMLVDIDRFRAIAGSLGHETGDLLLRHVAKTIRDEAPSDAIVARFRALPPIGPTYDEIMEEMYDENGLPR